MWFVLVIVLVVVAGWIYMAANQGRSGASRNPSGGSDDSAPVNAYDNPYDTDESNDRPFEPDASDDACAESSSDDSGGCDGSSD